MQIKRERKFRERLLEGKKCYEVLGKDLPCSFNVFNKRYRKLEKQFKKREKVGQLKTSAKSSHVADSEGNIYAAVEVFRDVTRKKTGEGTERKKQKDGKDLLFAKTLQQNSS